MCPLVIECPEEAGQFTRDGGDGFLPALAAGEQGARPPIESVLCTPGDLLEAPRLVLLPAAELLADFGRMEIMLRR
jgi:hypothetical protein